MKHKISIEVDETNYIELVNIKEITEEVTGLKFDSLGEFLSLAFEVSFEGYDDPHYWLRHIFE